MKKTGLVILVIGLGLTIFTAFTFFSKEKVADIGNDEITRDKPHKVKWSPWVGVAVMALGGGMMFLPVKKR